MRPLRYSINVTLDGCWDHCEVSAMQKAQMTEGSEGKEGTENDRSVKLRLQGDDGARRALGYSPGSTAQPLHIFWRLFVGAEAPTPKKSKR